jgi:outer membrane receptor protein involved in Fe transport
MTNRRVLARQALALAAAVSGVFVLNSSRAQQATNQTAQPGLTEIIVTAQKRAQNIQDVPISVIAFSAEQLKDAGVTDIKNLQNLTPGLTVTSTTSEDVTTARIRGIGTVGDNPGLESSVGVVIDGVYRPRNGVGFGNLGEIEQIQVLEGPQGELFGKNNDAGVINITTKKPSMTFGATAEATVGNFNDREINASITGPLSDISAGRLYFGYQRRDGFLNVDTGLGPNTSNSTDNRNMYTVRGQYLITPSDALNFLLIADFSRRNESCCGAVQTATGPFAGIINVLASDPELGGQPGVTGIATNPLSPAERLAWSNSPVSQQIRDMGVSGELNWDLGFGKFTSITAWRDNSLIAGNDVDYTGVDITSAPATSGNLTDFKQVSEELRLAGKSGPLDWLVGGFFSNEMLAYNTAIYAGNDFGLYVGGLGSAFATGFPNFATIPQGTFTPGVSGEQDYYTEDSKSYAFFTNETYNITQGLDLTAGLRYTGTTKSATSNFVNPDGGLGCASLLASGTNNPFILGYGCSTVFNPFFSPRIGSNAPLTTNQSLSEGNVSGTVKLSYRFNDDLMTYISWANGYKAGGFNLSRVTAATGAEGALTPNFDTEFPREVVESYEIGLKSLLFNNTLRFNASIFDQQYTNFQFNTFTGIQFVVTSLRKVESKGAEFDTTWATPVSGLTLSTGVTWAFTNINEFGAQSLALFAPNDTSATTLNRENDRLSFAPLWSGVTSATYRVPLSSSLEFHATASEKYDSSYNTGSDLDPRKIQGAYGLLDGRIGVGSADGKWTVEFWGANLTNKFYYQVAFDAPFQYNQIDAFVGDPRTWGITARTKF